MIKKLAKKEISRTPPVSVRRKLRAEVNFGCPLCGSPHLEYHHFDPPFARNNHHNPDGMIALCATHHAQADGFSIEQMREFKKTRQNSVESTFNWRRKHTVFVCGGSYAYQCNVMLYVRGVNILYFEKDENGFDTLSLNVFDTQGDPLFIMKKNDWISKTNVDDIVAPPKANKIHLLSYLNRIEIDIDFKDRAKLDASELDVCTKFKIPNGDNVVFCYFRGEIRYPLPVSFKSSSISCGGLILRGGYHKNSQYCIYLL